MANKVTAPRQVNHATGWVGWIFFAAVMMMLSGLFQFFYGLVAIVNGDYFVVTPSQLVAFNVTAWGWIHLVTGLLVLLAGVSLLSGSWYGRAVGVIMASLSAFAALADLSLFPIWSVIVITINIFVIFALTAHGDELRE